MLETAATTFQAALASQQVKADLVLELSCGPRPTEVWGARVHICCENRTDHLSALQNAALQGHDKYVIFRASPIQALAALPDNAVDLVLISDLAAAANGASIDELLEECKRVAARQVVLKTSSPASDISAGDGAHARVNKNISHDWALLWAEPGRNGTENEAHRQSDPRNSWLVWSKPRPARSRMPFKAAIVSIVFPPQDSGQATVLGRILEGIEPDDYCLISSQNYSEQSFPRNMLKQPSHVARLGARFYHMTSEVKWTRRLRLLPRALRYVASIPLQISHRSKVIARVVRDEQCNAVIGCSGELIEFAAAYFASRRAKVPFYAYLFDEYRFQSVLQLHRIIGAWVERRALQAASAVIVTSEFLRDKYRERYGVEAYVVRNPVEDVEPEPVELVAGLGSEREISILYTGQVYDAHYDAFQRLVEAIERLDELKVRLHIYTAQPPAVLQQHGIRGPVVFHDFQPTSRIRYLQQNADILFLPLAFHSPYPEIILTASPTKLGEYLISGRPILAPVPKGSFVSWFLRTHESGMVVDEPEPHQLADAIRVLASDREKCQQLANNARHQGKAFAVDTARANLLRILSNASR